MITQDQRIGFLKRLFALTKTRQDLDYNEAILWRDWRACFNNGSTGDDQFVNEIVNETPFSAAQVRYSILTKAALVKIANDPKHWPRGQGENAWEGMRYLLELDRTTQNNILSRSLTETGAWRLKALLDEHKRSLEKKPEPFISSGRNTTTVAVEAVNRAFASAGVSVPTAVSEALTKAKTDAAASQTAQRAAEAAKAKAEADRRAAVLEAEQMRSRERALKQNQERLERAAEAAKANAERLKAEALRAAEKAAREAAKLKEEVVALKEEIEEEGDALADATALAKFIAANSKKLTIPKDVLKTMNRYLSAGRSSGSAGLRMAADKAK